MFGKVENILFYAKIYYYFAKVNGLNSIVFKQSSLLATSTYFSRWSNCIISAVTFSAMISTQCYTFTILLKDNHKFVIEVMSVINLLVCIFNMHLIYFNQIYSHRLHLKFINQAIEVYRQFLLSMSMNQNYFFDRSFVRCYVLKVLLTALQVCACGTIYAEICRRIFVENVYANRAAVFAFLILYSTIVRSIITSFYYWCLMLVVQFYRKVNSKLDILITKIELNNEQEQSCRKMQVYLNISDALDLLCNLISLIDNLLSTVKNMFEIHLLWASIECCSNILNNVI